MKVKPSRAAVKPAQQLSMRKPLVNSPMTALSIAIPSLIAAPMVTAQDVVEMDTLQIEERTLDTNPYAEPGAPYKAKISGDKRHVKPLAKTPQTITVLTETALEESGDTDLREVLMNQPGITLGTGENGNAFGDRYVIRGHEARSDVFVDGLRDPGMTIRESFAVEQIEITKGPSSTFAGRGSTGGAVNSITKQASTEYDFNKVELGLGSDKYRRATLDSNVALTDQAALRVNLLHADRDVPNREPVSRERNGAAISGAFEATDKLGFIADYYYLKAEDKPDLGTYLDSTSGRPVEDIPVYTQDEDFLESEVKTATFRVNYEISDAIRFENATRYGTTENGYMVTGTRGGMTLSSHQGWQEVDYLANLANLFWDTEIAGMDNQFVFSIEYTNHDVLNGNYDYTVTGTSNCTVNANPNYCFSDGAGNYLPNLNTVLQRDISKGSWDADYAIETVSIGVMDTIDLNDQWSLFLGIRADRFDYENNVVGRGATVPTLYEYSDTLWNGHIGAVYQMTEAGNVYLTYSTSSNINGGESDVGGSCGYGGLCGDETTIGNSQPEKTRNIELGTKWNLFDEKLLATAAVFQITKDDVMEGADYVTTGTLNTGKNRVEGVEIGLTGNLTDTVSVQFGAALMEAEILESFNDGVNQTLVTRGPNAGTYQVTSDARGKTLANFAEKSAFLQLRHQPTEAFSYGANLTYASEVFVGQPDSAANEDRGVPSYTVYDLFATYAFTPKLSARLNVGNITDKAYYLTAYRSGAFVYIGDARNAQLSISYEF